MWHTHICGTHTHVKIKTSLKKIHTRLSMQVTSKFNFISLSICFCFVLIFIYLHVHTCVCHNMQVEVWGQAVGVSCHIIPCESQGLNSDHWALEQGRQHLSHDYFLSTCCIWRALCWLSKILTSVNKNNNKKINKVIVVLTNVPVFGHFYTVLVRLSYPMSKYLTETTERAKGLFCCPSVFSTTRQPRGVLQSSREVPSLSLLASFRVPSLWNSHLYLKWVFHT